MSAEAPSRPALYLPEVEIRHQPGVYRDLVWTALRDLDRASLDDKTKLLLRFVGTITTSLPATNASDIDALRVAGWDDEAIYFAITTCALFNFYNRWITATGVPEMSAGGYQQQGRALAERGYVRE